MYVTTQEVSKHITRQSAWHRIFMQAIRIVWFFTPLVLPYLNQSGTPLNYNDL
jgi:hypothetical protein